MIVKSGEAERFAAKPPATLKAALVFGPDAGLVRERAIALMKSVVPDLHDPFRVAELDENALESDPARLNDEAAALSMVGGRRVVHVRGAGNALAKLFERFLEQPAGDALVVVDAGDLAKSASLRRVFEEGENAAALACYPDSARDLEELVRAHLKTHGLSIEPDALDYAVARLGADRGVSRSELDKLSLYAMGENKVTVAHVEAVMGDESELRMDETFDAAGEGDYRRLDRALHRLWDSGVSPVGVLRQAMAHFQRLLSVRAEADAGMDLNACIRKMRPPVHFARADSLRSQLRRLSLARIQDALALLYEAEMLSKTTAVPAEAATGRALLSVAALANAKGP